MLFLLRTSVFESGRFAFHMSFSIWLSFWNYKKFLRAKRLLTCCWCIFIACSTLVANFKSNFERLFSMACTALPSVDFLFFPAFFRHYNILSQYLNFQLWHFHFWSQKAMSTMIIDTTDNGEIKTKDVVKDVLYSFSYSPNEVKALS